MLPRPVCETGRDVPRFNNRPVSLGATMTLIMSCTTVQCHDVHCNNIIYNIISLYNINVTYRLSTMALSYIRTIRKLIDTYYDIVIVLSLLVSLHDIVSLHTKCQ